MIICIIGKARHGKDTAVDVMERVIKEEYDLQVNRLALAHPLKLEALKYLGLDTIEELDYYKNKNIPVCGINVRSLLQQLGDTNTIRDKHHYCNLIMDKIHSIPSDTVTIISDVRLLHEHKYFRKLSNVVFVKVHRNILLENDVHNEHPSEGDVTNMSADYYIHNKELDKYKASVAYITNVIMNSYLNHRQVVMNPSIQEEVYSMFNKSSYL